MKQEIARRHDNFAVLFMRIGDQNHPLAPSWCVGQVTMPQNRWTFSTGAVQDFSLEAQGHRKATPALMQALYSLRWARSADPKGMGNLPNVVHEPIA